MKIYVLLCVITIWVRFGMAQGVSVTGIVKDTETHQPISFCNVRVMNAALGTTANVNGVFSITLPDSLSQSVLIFSSLGYGSDSVTLTKGIDHYSFFLTTAQSTLDEVVITGIAPITFKENPISITTISSSRLERTIESNIIDVLVKNVPGLNAVKTGPNISKPFIRGLGYNRVLMLYDGVRQEGQQWGDEHGIEVDAYAVERAEVIKGPASLMYGSDALAGVVSFFPFVPKENDRGITGKFVSEYQSNNGLVGNGLRLGHAGNRWTWTCTGSYRLAKNYKNDNDGHVYNTGFKEKNVSAAVRYKADRVNVNLNFTLYDNLQGIPDGSRDSLTRKFTKQIYEGSKDDIKQRPVVSKNELDTYIISPLHQHIQHYRLYSNSEYQVGGGNVHALLGIQQSVRREYNHPTDPTQAGLFVRLNTLNYSFRYNAPAFFNVDVSAGVNGMLQDNKNKTGTDFPIPDFNLYDIGAYGFIKWKHNDFTISGGVRYDKRYIISPDFYVLPNPDNGFMRQASNADVDATLQFPSLHQTFHGMSLSIGTTYSVSQSVSLKANVARGYRAPNISEIASNGLDPGAHIVYLGNRNFVPEFSFQQDLGVYADFSNVVASVSVFNNFLQHYIFLSQVTDEQGEPVELVQGNKTFQYKQASAGLYGAEASFDFRPKTIKGFNLAANMSAVYGNNTSKNFDGKGTEGQYLPFIPPLKILSSVSQNFNLRSHIVPSFNIKTEIDFNASQNRYMALYHTETRTSSYSLFNASCNFDVNYIKKARMQIQFQINNVFNIVYQSNLSRLKYFEYYNQSPNGMLACMAWGETFV